MYNAYSGDNNVLDKLISKCRNAYHAGYPIIYIATDDMEIIDQFIDKQDFIEFYRQSPECGGSYVPVKYVNEEGYHKTFRHKNPEFGTNNVSVYITETIPNKAYCFFSLEKKKTGAYVPIMCVYHHYVGRSFNPSDRRHSDNLYDFIDGQRKMADSGLQSLLVLCSCEVALPKALEKYISVIDVDLPDENEIKYTIDSMLDEFKSEAFLNRNNLIQLITSFKGFSCSDIRSILRRILCSIGGDINNYSDFDRDIIKAIESEKEQMIRKGAVLELVKNKGNKPKAAGLDNYLKWLKGKAKIVSKADEYRDTWGINCPKGVLLCGVPGTGKSLAASDTAALLGLPLIRMDVGSLMGSLVGESERNMREALKLAQAISPCVLFIDELEKGFSGSKDGGGDSGTFKRMFGNFLTWMQENDSPCFIFATANDISGLPEEFFRNGRFDQAFALYMPTSRECVSIYRSIMEKAEDRVRTAYRLTPNKTSGEITLFDWEKQYTEENMLKLVNLSVKDGRTKFLTGADIQVLVNSALILISQNASGAFSIDFEVFLNAVDHALESERTFGDSSSNLMSIANCYIMLMSKSFTPAAPTVLFDKLQFAENLDKIAEYRLSGNKDKDVEVPQAITEEAKPNWSDYDRALFNALKKHINKLAQYPVKNK